MKPFAEYTWRCADCGREFKPSTRRAPAPRCTNLNRGFVHQVRLVLVRILEPLVLLPEVADR